MFSYAMHEMANKIHENINAVPTAFLGSTVCALMHKDAIQHRSGLRDEAQEMNAFVNFLPLAFRPDVPSHLLRHALPRLHS